MESGNQCCYVRGYRRRHCYDKGSCSQETFYQPQGLFNTKFSLASSDKRRFANYVFASPLYKKNAALGIEVTLKKGKKAGTVYLNEHLHIAKDEIHTAGELPYLQQDFEEE